jgi:hypothetical protein
MNSPSTPATQQLSSDSRVANISGSNGGRSPLAQVLLNEQAATTSHLEQALQSMSISKPEQQQRKREQAVPTPASSARCATLRGSRDIVELNNIYISRKLSAENVYA